MDYIRITDTLDRVKTYGRAFLDEEGGVLYSNYTCGGFELLFRGSTLIADFAAIPDTFVPPGAPPVSREDWPWISVFLDGSDTPCRRMRVRDGECVLLFSGLKAEEHRVKIVKLTENFRTALGIRGFRTDGELLCFQPEQKEIIEFIGDSITCGFGNDTPDPSHEFEAAEEDGWMTHGAIAARMLNLEPRFISVSGISVENPVPMPGFYCMRDLYPYTDRILEDKLAQQRGRTVSEYRPFDFGAAPAKYVVLNLGTNDANQIYFREDKEQAEADFENNYFRFLSEIRRLNGPDTTIVCALGCMDYYLWDKICKVAERFRTETGDGRILTLKYNKMMNMGPDVGGCLHPAIHRHKLMAVDLVRRIRES